MKNSIYFGDCESPRLTYLDLQLFAGDAGEKTEKATPKRRQEARKKGQVVRSTELNSALILLLTFFVLYLTLPYLFGEIAKFAQKALFVYTRENISPEFVHALLGESLLMVGRIVAPVMAVAFVTGLAANYIQVGVLLTTETLKFNPGRLNPIEGFKRIFSKRALVELFKSLWKVTAVSFVVYSVISDQIGLFPQLMEVELVEVIGLVNKLVWSIGWRVGLLLFILSILDYLYQRWEHEKNLRMSKREIKDEYKQMEGDPLVRSKIKERQRQMAMQRMMSQVPQADVVITNPTHLAIALRYRSAETASPVLIAKGQGIVAQKIKTIAEKQGIPIVENKSLAQILYKTVELGQMVPETLYQAVAEVLAYVYRLKRKAF